jgi:hypothetical protein
MGSNMRRAIEVALVCLVAAAVLGGCAGDLDDAVGREIRKRVSVETPPSSEGGASWDLIRQVYRDREERPLWSRRGQPLARARDLVASTSTDIAGCRPSSRTGTSWSTFRTSSSGPTMGAGRPSSSG